MKLSESFFAGLFLALMVGGISLYYHSNYRMKQLVDKNGNTATCQVIHYRFWYEIRNCSKPEMNQKTVWLNHIEDYQIQ